MVVDIGNGVVAKCRLGSERKCGSENSVRPDWLDLGYDAKGR